MSLYARRRACSIVRCTCRSMRHARGLYALSMRAWDGVRVEWRAYTTCAAQVRPPLRVFAHVHLRACLQPRSRTSHKHTNAVTRGRARGAADVKRTAQRWAHTRHWCMPRGAGAAACRRTLRWSLAAAARQAYCEWMGYA